MGAKHLRIVATQPEARAKRLSEIESMLCRRVTRSKIVETINEKYAVTTLTVDNDIREIHRRWARESHGENTQNTREHLIKNFEDVIAAAWEVKAQVFSSGGEAVRDENGEILYRPTPDFKAIIQSLIAIGKMRGCFAINIEAEVRKNLEVMLDRLKPHMSENAYIEFIKAIEAVSK